MDYYLLANHICVRNTFVMEHPDMHTTTLLDIHGGRDYKDPL